MPVRRLDAEFPVPGRIVGEVELAASDAQPLRLNGIANRRTA
jgi:hypothetical protein